ncbi:MAG: UDP-N-acetylmuramoyl-L-alanyl-D-glutamate--2,6-diaminopimelate ligase [Rhodothermales bacterium]|jgi:UDP-N-acetylmuramoyl-L-alanyl-D-glutamate--2,6-diaminopimelate ligase
MITRRDTCTLGDVLTRLSGEDLLVQFSGQTSEMLIHAVTSDSREVTPGTLFVAIEGTQFDGHAYIEQATESGASALLVSRPVETDLPTVQVSDTRLALAHIGALIVGDPGKHLGITAVTGTNGKTTTAWLLAQALNTAGIACGYMGTIGYGMPGSLKTASHTTPDPVKLQMGLASLLDAGCKACAIEASSHAIDQQRTAAIPYQSAVFTNLTRDHLDYHGTLEAYLDAKARLFEELDPAGQSVINIDDPAGRELMQRVSSRVLTYGSDPAADIRLDIISDRTGLRLRLDGHDARFRLSGAFNAHNIAAAYGALESYGLTGPERIEALAQAESAPGRFEILPIRKDRVAVVDYAHTPDALQNVLKAARGILPAGANLWCVFGCGGERDTGKRPLMGEVAEKLADRVVVTSDNPRTEDPQEILDQIRQGVKQPEQVQWVIDRAEAVNRAIQTAGVGDVVVVAGKGPEPYQIVGTEYLPYSDMAQITQAARV